MVLVVMVNLLANGSPTQAADGTSWNNNDRILVVAPHPDDELLGAGGVIHDAVRAGAEIHVLLVTNGDGFSWAARHLYKRPRVGHSQFRDFGLRRQQESVNALERVGLAPNAVTFLGYPDRGIAPIWERHWSCAGSPYRSPFTGATHVPYSTSLTPDAPHCGQELVRQIQQVMNCFHPTLVLVPHANDAHIDHWGTHNFTVFSLESMIETGMQRPRTWFYLTHRGDWPTPGGLRPERSLRPPAALAALDADWLGVDISAEGITAKHQGLLEYRTQLPLLRQYLLSFVAINELFAHDPPAPLGEGESVEVPLAARDETVWLPSQEEAVVGHPERDTLKRRLLGAADIKALRITSREDHFFFTLELRRNPSIRVYYDVWVMAFHDQADQVDDRQFRFSFSPPRAIRVVGSTGRTRQAEQVTLASTGQRQVQLRVPREVLGAPTRLFVGARTRSAFTTIDWTAWRLVRVTDQTRPTQYFPDM